MQSSMLWHILRPPVGQKDQSACQVIFSLGALQVGIVVQPYDITHQAQKYH
jgi:hypothetical protein